MGATESATPSLASPSGTVEEQGETYESDQPDRSSDVAQVEAVKTTNDLQQVLESFEVELTETPFRVALGNFTFQNTGVPSDFAGYLAGELSSAISASDGFTEYSRRDLDAIMTEQELSLTDIIDGTDTPSVGILKAVHGIFVGEYWSGETQTTVQLRLLDVESGGVLASSTVALPNLELPQKMAVAPPGLEGTSQALSSFRDGHGLNQFGIKLWIDRGDGGLYKVGDELQIRFQADVDCYLRLYHLSANDELQMIFPNDMSQRSLLKAGEVHVFPGEGTYSFVLSKPLGTELIYAVASTDAFSFKEQALTSLGGAKDIPSVRTRGLKVVAKDSRLSERTCVYTVID